MGWEPSPARPRLVILYKVPAGTVSSHGVKTQNYPTGPFRSPTAHPPPTASFLELPHCSGTHFCSRNIHVNHQDFLDYLAPWVLHGRLPLEAWSNWSKPLPRLHSCVCDLEQTTSMVCPKPLWAPHYSGGDITVPTSLLFPCRFCSIINVNQSQV